MAAVMLWAFGTSPAASADTTRTLNLALRCTTGLPYGLLVSNGSSWYVPSSGSSYAVGNTKYYTLPIPASATSLAFQPTYCENQAAGYGPYWEGYTYSITPGTSTINASGLCDDYPFNYGPGQPYLLYYCSLSSLS